MVLGIWRSEILQNGAAGHLVHAREKIAMVDEKSVIHPTPVGAGHARKKNRGHELGVISQ